MCVGGGWVFLKGLRGGVRTYKNDNASQDGSFYGFSLFFKRLFFIEVERMVV